MDRKTTGIRKTLEQELLKKYSDLTIKKIKGDQIVFENRVKLKCFQCKNYGVKPTCPPFSNDIDFEKIIKNEYSHILVFILEKKINGNLDEVRIESTNQLHRILLHAEKILYDNNYSLATSFIGGSCKLCKEGCNRDKCSNPQMARIPMEATGINVIESLKSIDIEIIFPIEDSLSRYGILVW